MRYFIIFQDKLHSVNIQDEPNRSKISENFQNHPYGQLVLVSIVRAVSVVECLNEPVHRPGPPLRIMLRAAILDEFQINLAGGGQFGRKREK